MRYVFIGILIMAGLYGLHRLATWAERRGWVHYRKGSGRSGSLGNALLELQSLVEPAKRHVLEEMRRDDARAEESGEPPDPAAGQTRTGPDGRGLVRTRRRNGTGSLIALIAAAAFAVGACGTAERTGGGGEAEGSLVSRAMEFRALMERGDDSGARAMMAPDARRWWENREGEVGERPPGKTDEFVAWAKANDPDELESLMPGGEIDPSGDHPQRFRRLLERWREASGLGPMERG